MQNPFSISFSKSGLKLAVWNQSHLKLFNTLDYSEITCSDNQYLSIVEFYEDSDLLFLVGSGEVPQSSQRVLSIWNHKSNHTITELGFEKRIKSVCSNLIRLIIALDERVLVLKTDNFKCIASISDLNTLKNVNLAQSSEYCLMAYTNSESQGYVHIYDSFNGNSVNVLPCHKSSIAILALSYTGKKLATASGKGTIIKLFDSITGDLLHQFQRGISVAVIYSLLFTNSDEDLVVTSSTGTLHIFQIDGDKGGKKALELFVSVLPSNLYNHFNSDQSLVSSATGFVGKHQVCAVNKNSILIFDANLNYTLSSYTNRNYAILKKGRLSAF